MFYSTVYPELKAIVFNQDNVNQQQQEQQQRKKKKKKKPGKETSPAVKPVEPWRMGSRRSSVWFVEQMEAASQV